MQYLGGKKRLAKRIAAILDEHRSDGQLFIDMFCGSLAISAAMPNRGPAIANDACIPLINLYKSWREGWRPPEHVSEELYAELKAKQDPDDPLTAFAGFGCSWGGKWFGGYARNSEGRNFAGTAARSTARSLGSYDGELVCGSFAQLGLGSEALVYCDPAYRGTTKYNYFKAFDHDAFEDCAQLWADAGATVFVSEYAKQRGTWEQIAEWSSKRDIDLVAPIGYYTPVLACTIANVIASARAALAAAPRGTVPTVALRVTRDVRLFGPEHKRFVGGWERGGLEVYRHEQLRFAFVATTVSEQLDVAVIDEGTGLFRLELASEQHLWIKHSNWTHDPVPTIVADLDEDGELVAREPYTVETLA